MEPTHLNELALKQHETLEAYCAALSAALDADNAKYKAESDSTHARQIADAARETYHAARIEFNIAFNR